MEEVNHLMAEAVSEGERHHGAGCWERYCMESEAYDMRSMDLPGE